MSNLGTAGLLFDLVNHKLEKVKKTKQNTSTDISIQTKAGHDFFWFDDKVDWNSSWSSYVFFFFFKISSRFVAFIDSKLQATQKGHLSVPVFKQSNFFEESVNRLDE